MIKNKLQHSNKDHLKSMGSSSEILDKALELCRAYGATDAELGLQQEQGFDVEVRLGQVEAVSFHQKQGLSVIVYRGHRKGLASSTDLSEQAIDMIVKAACDMAQLSEEDPYYGLADAGYWQRKVEKNLDLYHLWNLSPEQAIEKAIKLEAVARSKDERIVNAESSYVSTYQMMSTRMNTQGFYESHQSTRHGMGCSLVAGQAQHMQTDYAYTTAIHPDDLSSIEDLATLVASRVCRRLGAKSLTTRQVPVIFSNRVSAGLIGSLISAISGQQLYRKNSFLCDTLGQKVCADCIHIQEFPFILRGLGSACYDGDGIPTQENIFVADGYLQQYVLGVYSARRLNLKPSGNADGTHNLTVKANAGDLTDVIKKMHRGFLVTELMGQGVNILTGDYSRGASGFWVEDGQIQYPVEGVTIAGNLKDMFLDIVAVGSDVEKNYATRCGSILIEKMTVAGQ